MGQADKNGDGKIDISEFKELLMGRMSRKGTLEEMLFKD